MNNEHDDDVQLLEVELTAGQRTTLVLIDCTQVLEVIEDNSFEALPELTFPFIGLLTLRGAPVPVLELDQLMGGERIETTGTTRFIICKAEAGVVALRVQGTLRIRAAISSRVERVPEAFSTHATNIACSHLIRDEAGHYAPVVDVESVICKLIHNSTKSESSSRGVTNETANCR